MTDNFYKSILQQSPFGYAYHKVACDETGKPIDYEFIEINRGFEKLTGLKGSDIIGKSIKQIQPGIGEGEFDWISSYGEVALGFGDKEFEQYSLPLDRWYKVYAYSPQKYYFVTIFTDVTNDYLFSKISYEFNQYSAYTIDYQKITDRMLQISGAKYAILNCFDDNGKDFITCAISGLNTHVKKAISMLGFELIGKKWSYDSRRERIIKEKKTTVFSSLDGLTGGAIAKKTVSLLLKTFRVKEAAIVKVTKDDVMISDFTLIFEEGKSLINEKFAESYADLVGMLLSRIKAEQALVNKTEELDRFFSVNLDLLCIADMEGNFIRVNKAWEDILGYTTSELEKRKFLEFVHPDDLEATLEEMGNLEKRERVLNFVNRYKCRDGTYKYIEWRSKPHGSLIYAAARDITEAMQTQERLRISETNFKTFFETIDDLIFIANQQGEIFYTNSAAKQKIGYTQEELKGMHVLDVHPKNKREEAEQIFSEMFAGQRDYCPLPLVKKDGSLVPVETRIWFGKWDGKECIFGVSKDLTKEQEALQKFNRLFENNPALMAISSIPEQVFNDVNDAFLQKTGYGKEEILGRTSGELGLFVQSEEQKLVAKELERTGKISNCELKVKTKSGEILDGLFAGEVIESQGEQYFLTVMTDITIQKRAEEEAKSANEAKTRFLANMSHEIRTPMNGILGFLQLLEHSKLNEEQTGYISNIKTSTDILLSVINDILDVSKIESGKMEMEEIKFDLRSTIETATIPYTAKVHEKGIELNMLINPDIPKMVIGDSTRIRQVIGNLVSNAVKFTDKGDIFIEAALNSQTEDYNEIMVKVKDTGVGMPKDMMDRLFEPFTQVDVSTTRKYGGTGLGLSICKSIVEMMNGDIRVESEENKGSTFTFSVMLKRVEEGEEESQESVFNTRNTIREASFGQELKLLIVEDNKINRTFLIKLLQINGMSCEIAKNGEEAVRACHNKDYDIIFMDCQMPVMDGYEATRKIREAEGGDKHTVIVAMTAFAMEGDMQKCLESGMDDYLSKPINQNGIVKMIKKWSKGDIAVGTSCRHTNGKSEKKNYFNDVVKKLMNESGLDREESEELLKEFRWQTRDIIYDIKKHMELEDMESVRNLLHQLRGSSGNVRANEIELRVLDMREAVKKGNILEAKEKLKSIEELVNLLQEGEV